MGVMGSEDGGNGGTLPYDSLPFYTLPSSFSFGDSRRIVNQRSVAGSVPKVVMLVPPKGVMGSEKDENAISEGESRLVLQCPSAKEANSISLVIKAI